MKLLTCHIVGPLEADAIVNSNRTKLVVGSALSIYMENQWYKNTMHWMACHRGEYAKTNNVAESHFKQLKYEHLACHGFFRIDDFAQKLIGDVFPDFIFNYHSSSARPNRIIKIINTIPDVD
jgi:hypothetical protein